MPHLGIFYIFTIWDRRLYLPSEGRRAEECFALKIDGRVPKVSTLPLHHRSRFLRSYSW